MIVENKCSLIIFTCKPTSPVRIFFFSSSLLDPSEQAEVRQAEKKRKIKVKLVMWPGSAGMRREDCVILMS